MSVRSVDELSLMADEEFSVSPERRGNSSSDVVEIERAVKSVLQGELTTQIRRIVEEQTASVFGKVAGRGETRCYPQSSDTSGVTMASFGDWGDTNRRGLAIGLDIIEAFDPEDPESSVERWLDKIEQHGKIHGWGEYHMSTIMQSKLIGAAKKWYHRLDRYDFTWGQWRVKLATAFPRRHDFATLLEEMVQRRKLTTESMTTYYHAKLELCCRVHITGPDAVSCIIRGLPEELRANAYAAAFQTPERLYNQFLAGLESYRCQRRTRGHEEEAEGRPVKRQALQAVQQSSLQQRQGSRCYNCQEWGHISKECAKAKVDRCWNCGKGGHQAKGCPSKQEKVKVRLIVTPKNSVFRQTGYVGGVAVRVYIDTGSERNLVSYDTVTRLGIPIDNLDRSIEMRGVFGGKAYALGEVQFTLMLSCMEMVVKALVTDVEMGRIEVLLGEEATTYPGIALVVRKNKAIFVEEPDMAELLRSITLEEESSRCGVYLVADFQCLAGNTTSASVEAQNKCSTTVCWGARTYPVDGTMMSIPGGEIITNERTQIKISNLGEKDIYWKKGRLLVRAEVCRQVEAADKVNVLKILSQSHLDSDQVHVWDDITDEGRKQLINLLEKRSYCFSLGVSDIILFGEAFWAGELSSCFSEGH